MTITRRTFLHGTAVGLVTASASGCGNDVVPSPVADAQIIDDVDSPRDGQIEILVARYPELVPVGGAITLRLALLQPGPREYTIPTGNVLLIHRAGPDDPPEYVAVSATCTHAGCPLGYSAKDQLIECPCHSSRFRAVADPLDPGSRPGTVSQLPARAPLDSWEVRVERGGQVVYVDLKAPFRPALPPVKDGRVVIPIRDYPTLGTPGGSVVGQPAGLGDTVVVIRVDESTVAAVSAICTHVGCLVSFAGAQRDLACPCHGSRFALDGRVEMGPAERPLKAYRAELAGDTITLTV